MIDNFCRTKHNNIVTIFAHGWIQKDSALYYLETEWCDIGLDQYIHTSANAVHGLQRWANVNTTQRIFIIVAIMQQILSGLDFIHRHAQLHGNLNPRNGIGLLHRWLTNSPLLLCNWMVEACRCLIKVICELRQFQRTAWLQCS